MSEISKLFSNYTLNVALACWFSAQICKTIFHYVRTRKLRLERLAGSGGMPSAHSATVTGLTMAVARIDGIASPIFAVAAILTAIVLYDAIGVRRAAGEQAKVLNKMMDADLFSDFEDDYDFEIEYERVNEEEMDNDQHKKTLNEYLGHTPLEVACGSLMGIIISLIMPK